MKNSCLIFLSNSGFFITTIFSYLTVVSHRMEWVIPNNSHLHNLPYPKSKKIDSQRWPYLQIDSKKPRLKHTKLPDSLKIWQKKIPEHQKMRGVSNFMMCGSFRITPIYITSHTQRTRKLTAKGGHICKLTVKNKIKYTKLPDVLKNWQKKYLSIRR